MLSLFDRFETDDDDDSVALDCLARDIADLLGGRRLYSDSALGVLSFGLPSLSSIHSRGDDAKARVARYIEETLVRCEPRLSSVRVVPEEGAPDFQFQISANLVTERGTTLTLRILSPMLGGGLGAQAVVLDVSRS